MPIWDEVRLQLDEARKGGPGAMDERRRMYVSDLVTFTGVPLVVYAVDMLNSAKADQRAADISISPQDKDGWVEVTEGLPDGPLDLLLHSPGGSPFAAEWLINFLRRRFHPIRAIVPHTAKSAATMVAMGCDELMMDERGELGPIDPQMNLGGRAAPAQAILDQFAAAQEQLKDDATKLPAWIPLLQQMGPSLVQESVNAIALSKQLVNAWLRDNMFGQDPDRVAKAEVLSEWLGNHNNFNAHARMVSIDDLIARGAKVVDLRAPENETLRRHIWTVWTALSHTFDKTSCFKIFEGSGGGRLYRSVETVILSPDGPVNPLRQPSRPPPPPSAPNRAADRRKMLR